MAESAWEKLLPKYRGRLPGGGELLRTDPGGSPSARIAILRVHPEETAARVVRVRKESLRLPVAVEQRSFDGPISAKELQERVLGPLGLGEDQVYLLDAYPYYLAADAVRGERPSWSDIRKWREQSGEADDVQQRPAPTAIPDACRTLPGNVERLTEQLERGRPALLLTLGAETAAFVRGVTLADGQRALYAPAERRTVFGVALEVVHLAHLGILASPLASGSLAKHQEWCRSFRG
jgi:hypothetical protein